MKRAFAVITLALASVSACKKDEPAPAPPPQETVTIPVPQRDTAPRAPTPTTQAAAPATRSGGAPAAGTRSPAGAASTAGRDAEISQAARLYTVQVASFVNAAYAQALQTRLRGQGVPVWTTPARVQGREYTRVRIGVATTTADAQALARKIRQQYQWPVWITTVEDRGAVPPDAISATRAYAAR